MSQKALKAQQDPENVDTEKARKANEHLFRPGYYQDEEGHRRMMDALGVEMGVGHGDVGAIEAGERKWPLYKTVTLVLLVNLAAWAGIVAILRAVF